MDSASVHRSMHLQHDHFATRVYVVGEVMVSLVVLLGGFALVYFSVDDSVKLVGSGAISAATVFWFQRRSTESANNSLTMLANGKLTQLLEHQTQQQSRTDALVTMVADMRRDRPDLHERT